VWLREALAQMAQKDQIIVQYKLIVERILSKMQPALMKFLCEASALWSDAKAGI
jgi:hypothetical protein